MGEAGDGENRIHELTDLDVEAIGLVRRGANRRPFYVLKSESGGNDMTEQQEEQEFSDILKQLEEAEGVSKGLLEQVKAGFEAFAAKLQPTEPEPELEDFAELTAAEKKAIMGALKVGKDTLGDRLHAMLTKLVGNPVKAKDDDKKEYGYPPDKKAEKSSDEPNKFAEQLETMRTELTEEFAAKIEAAETKAEQAEKQAADERQRRRLAEFTDKAQEYSFAVEVEKFAEDLLALEDYDADLYSRWIKRLNALDEQVKQGALFEQFSVGGGETDTTIHPFLREVEKLHKEHYPTEKYAEGFVQAMELAERAHPDLAARYERETREVRNG
jgi:hypothetical protein